MSSEVQQYLIKAKKNELLVNHLVESCSGKHYFSWVFVVIFYSALHYFNAFLLFKGDTIPTKHKSKNDYDLGGIEIAKNKLFTCKNGYTHSAGMDFEQLFNWGYDARYRPLVNLSAGELTIALKYLDGIKMIVFNEIGFCPNRSSNRISTKPISAEYLKGLFESCFGSGTPTGTTR